jgi:hypothetical protein
MDQPTLASSVARIRCVVRQFGDTPTETFCVVVAATRRFHDMHIDKEFVLEELRKQGKNEHVQKAIAELPAKIDHEQHAALLQKFGIDPGKLVGSALERQTTGGAKTSGTS